MEVDCVIVGKNAARTLRDCLQSVKEVVFPDGLAHIIYVDGGSDDDSVEIAKGFPGVHVIESKTRPTTKGLSRNRGWQAGNSPYVQFLDADSVLSPFWWNRALPHLVGKVVAVRGRREEHVPRNSPYNWIDMEWNPTPGNCDAFGGDVLVQREVLQETGGYDEELVGFEDRELSYRITHLGYLILHLDAPMSRHDLAMAAPSQYWKRAYRTGYGFMAVSARHRKDERGFWIGELQRIAIRGGGAVALLVLSVLWAFWTFMGFLLLIPALILLFYPRLFGVRRLAKEHRISSSRAARYAWHCSFVVVPQFFGAIRFLLGRLFRWPLRE